MAAAGRTETREESVLAGSGTRRRVASPRELCIPGVSRQGDLSLARPLTLLFVFPLRLARATLRPRVYFRNPRDGVERTRHERMPPMHSISIADPRADDRTRDNARLDPLSLRDPFRIVTFFIIYVKKKIIQFFNFIFC